MKNIKGEELQDAGFKQYIEALEKLDQALAGQLEDRKKLFGELKALFDDKDNWDGSCPIGSYRSADGCVFPEKMGDLEDLAKDKYLNK